MIITICVCGAGTMGSGIAQVAAQSGFSVVLFDVNENMLDNARSTITKNLQNLANKGKISEEQRHEISGRIRYENRVEECTGFLIIEAIIEKEEAKIDLFNELAKYNNEEVIFATNTSSLSVSSIQEQVAFPERVAGMHFFNPAYIMPLVEVIKGSETNPQIIETIVSICRQMGKTPVVCDDAPGFIVNRVARQYYLESLRIVEEGVATVEQTDAIMEATGFKMGPFKLMDLIGMDINLKVTETLYESLGHAARFKPSKLQIKKVTDKELGKKSGKGFYDYS